GLRRAERPGDVRRQLPTELLAEPAARAGDGLDVDPGRDAEAAAHPHQILGGEVAPRRLRERRPADAAGARVEDGDAFEKRRERVGERLAVGVVEVHAELVHTHARRAVPIEQRHDGSRRAHADGVAERELVAAEVEQAPPDVDRDTGRRRTVPRIGEDHREIAADAQALVLRTPDDLAIVIDRFLARASQILSRVAVARRGEDGDLTDAAPEGALEALLLRNEHRLADAPPR